MLKGKLLNPKSTIGVISPASPSAFATTEINLNFLRSLGYNLKLGEHLYDCNNYLAGTDSSRGYDINMMFEDDSIDGIICLRGGYGSIRTLPHIDVKKVIDHPKFFCGYSDITLLLNYFCKLGLITFHGPMLNCGFNNNDTLKSFIEISTYNSKNYTYNLGNYNDISYINIASFEGKLIGGNLSIICSSIGTPYEIRPQNSILLIEEVDETPDCLDRMLTQLLNTDYFDSCTGIIIGHLTHHTSINLNVKSLYSVFIDRLSSLKIPLILGFPFGHNYPNLTIPIGCLGHFSKKNKSLMLLDNFLL